MAAAMRVAVTASARLRVPNRTDKTAGDNYYVVSGEAVWLPSSALTMILRFFNVTKPYWVTEVTQS
jgi:hypothetical protein